MKMTRCGEGIDSAGEIVIRTCIVSGAVYQTESTCGKCVKYLSLNPVGPLYAHLMSGLSNVICYIWGRANRKYRLTGGTRERPELVILDNRVGRILV